MRCFMNLVALTVFAFSLSAANFALAGHGGGHGHAGGGQSKSVSKSSNQSFSRQNNQQPKNKVITGTKNGVGFIADPAPRKLHQHGPKVTKIVDPIRPNMGGATVKGGGKLTTATSLQTNLIGLAPQPAGVGPVVRDHSIVKPLTSNSPPRDRYNSITSEGFGDSVGNTIVGLGDALGFDGSVGIGFTAPNNRPQVVDHRTQTSSGYYDHSHNPTQPFTPNTQGPANTIKPLNPPRTGGK